LHRDAPEGHCACGLTEDLLHSGKMDTVSVIVPVHNAAAFLDDTLKSVLAQTYAGPIECVAFNDCSSDDSLAVLQRWQPSFTGRFSLKIAQVKSSRPHGPGFARNRAVAASSGTWLCLLDADDICMPRRIELQLRAAKASPSALVGADFVRFPMADEGEGRYTAWHASLQEKDLYEQQWRECTLIQPTWFMHRDVFSRLGGYDEVPPPLLPLPTPVPAPAGKHAKAENPAAQPAIELAEDTASLRSIPDPFVVPTFDLAPTEESCSHVPALTPLEAIAYALTQNNALSRWPEHERPFRHPPFFSRPPLKLHPRHWESHVFTPVCEDTLFQARHLVTNGGKMIKVRDEEGASNASASSNSGGDDNAADAEKPSAHASAGSHLLLYRYSPSSQSWKIPRNLLLRIRVSLFEEAMLAPLPAHCWALQSSAQYTRQGRIIAQPERFSPAQLAEIAATTAAAEAEAARTGRLLWHNFTIWSAGRDGKAFYNALSAAGKAAVAAFVDIDAKKIGQSYPVPVKRALLMESQASKRRASLASIASAATAASAAADAGGNESLQQPSSRPESATGSAVIESSTGSGSGSVGGAAAEASEPPHKRRKLSSSKAEASAPDESHATSADSHASAAALAPIAEPVKIASILHAPCGVPLVLCVNLESGGAELQANVSKVREAMRAQQGGAEGSADPEMQPLQPLKDLLYFV
jgi:hypothetical protein